ncbi:MAG: hypothetical protein H6686_00240 [Fibrobacteria bacterium]|nr:hypothetical protein [Fibrobacteria bacterium]
MRSKQGLAMVLLASMAASAQSTVKVYGFADFRMSKGWMEDNNLLIPEGYINDDVNFYLGHVDPYIDWTPNEHVRALVELDLNPQPTVSGGAGLRLKLSDAGKAEVRTVLQQSITGQVIQGLMAQGMTLAQAQAAAPGIAQPMIDQAYDAVLANADVKVQDPSDRRRTDYLRLVRAQFDAKISDALNVRVGRFLTPVGIWSVDHGSPVILSIQQPYYISTVPIFPQVQEGAMLFGNLFLGDNDMEYALYLSKGREDANKGINRIQEVDDLSVGGQVNIRVDALNGTRFGASGYVGRQRTDKLWGDAGYELGLLKSDPSAPADLQPILPYLKDDTLFLDEFHYSRERTESLREFCWGLDFQTRYGALGVQAEINGALIQNDQLYSGTTGSALDVYGLVSWEQPVNQAITITPYLFYEQLTWADQENVPTWSIGLGNFPLAGFRTGSLGLNTSFWNNIRLKTEYTLVWLLPEAQSKDPIYRNHFTESDLFSQAVNGQITVAF